MVTQSQRQAHNAGLPVLVLLLNQRLKQAGLAEFGHVSAYYPGRESRQTW